MSSSNDSKPDNFHVNARICRQVSRYPCMYDRSHQFYLKKDVVDRAWLKIAKEMDDSIPSCKERWRNIRTSFARSINVNKIPASANRTKPYYLHEELQFLARHITPGIPVSRRSNNNNAYYSAGEESEVIEVSVGEESFDGFAQMVQNGAVVSEEADREQDEDSEEEQLSSADGEGNNNNDCSGISIAIKDEELTKQQRSPTPVVLVVAATPQAMVMEEASAGAEQEGEEEQHVAEAIAPLAVHAPLAVSPIISCPPKKRRRLAEREEEVKAMASPTPAPSPESEPEADPERDVKPNISLTADTDFDAIFLQNLLPEMKAMNFRQKLVFKRRIYEVISDIFEGPAPAQPETVAAASPSTTQATLSYITANRLLPAPPPAPASFSYTPASAAASAIAPPSAATSTMTVVNAADLAMIRRLNSLLQSPTGSAAVASSTTVTAVPKHVASISSTVRSTPPLPTATVAVHRGALTRSSANLLRVTMVSAPSPASSSSATAVASSSTPLSLPYANAQGGPHVVKLEHDEAESLEGVD